MADDPHLGLATPSVWYQMHLEAPSVNVSGVIFAGIPGIILGHNEKVAWGVTNAGPDVQDLYIEKRNPENLKEFAFKGKWEKAQILDEPIRVKDGKTLDYKVTVTRHGPVVSEFAGKSGKDTVLALRWTALDPSAELEAVLNMNKAGNWKEFEKALLKFETPAQNFVFASVDGTIAYKANGRIPIRKKAIVCCQYLAGRMNLSGKATFRLMNFQKRSIRKRDSFRQRIIKSSRMTILTTSAITGHSPTVR